MRCTGLFGCARAGERARSEKTAGKAHVLVCLCACWCSHPMKGGRRHAFRLLRCAESGDGQDERLRRRADPRLSTGRVCPNGCARTATFRVSLRQCGCGHLTGGGDITNSRCISAACCVAGRTTFPPLSSRGLFLAARSARSSCSRAVKSVIGESRTAMRGCQSLDLYCRRRCCFD